MGFGVRGGGPVGLGRDGGRLVPGPAQGARGAGADVGFQGGRGEGVLGGREEEMGRGMAGLGQKTGGRKKKNTSGEGVASEIEQCMELFSHAHCVRRHAGEEGGGGDPLLPPRRSAEQKA